MRKSLFDISDQLFVQRKNSGIVLTNPDKIKNSHNAESLTSVAKIFQLPLNVCFLDTNSVIHNINEQTIKTTGFNSLKEAIGKTVRVVAKREIAEQLIANDRKVLNANHLIVKEDNYTRLVDDVYFQAITFKTPWYSHDDKILGVFFCSITIGLPDSPPLADALALICNLGLFNGSPVFCNQLQSATGLNVGNIYISKRESQCLYYLTRGKTIKMTAKILDLSPRTVGHYLENLKAKFNVISKSDLIEKTIHYFPVS